MSQRPRNFTNLKCKRGHLKLGFNRIIHHGRTECRTCLRKSNRDRLEKLKKLLLGIIGDKCICCGVSQWWNLTFDHISPIRYKGNRHKLHSSSSYYNIILKNKNFADFQTMCFGCNNSKNVGNKCMLNHG